MQTLPRLLAKAQPIKFPVAKSGTVHAWAESVALKRYLRAIYGISAYALRTGRPAEAQAALRMIVEGVPRRLGMR